MAHPTPHSCRHPGACRVEDPDEVFARLEARLDGDPGLHVTSAMMRRFAAADARTAGDPPRGAARLGVRLLTASLANQYHDPDVSYLPTAVDGYWEGLAGRPGSCEGFLTRHGGLSSIAGRAATAWALPRGVVDPDEEATGDYARAALAYETARLHHLIGDHGCAGEWVCRGDMDMEVGDYRSVEDDPAGVARSDLARDWAACLLQAATAAPDAVAAALARADDIADQIMV